MPLPCSYENNPASFAEFYATQRRLVAGLSRHPDRVRGWFESKPQRATAIAGESSPSQAWRSARLNSLRRRQLAALLDQAPSGDGAAALAAWLLAAIPVASYLEIVDFARSDQDSLDAETDRCARQVVAMRNRLLADNYGLAKAAACRRRGEDFDDCLSAACNGLLDAIDRYVPGERAARFSYFATYWIRYHLGRQAQKRSCLVSVPINQHRIGRRIERFVEERVGRGLPAPTPAEIRAGLALGVEAFYQHGCLPEVVSLHAGSHGDPESRALEHVLCDPGPTPGREANGDEVCERIRGWLRRRVPPATRVMLAYRHGIGGLAEAAEDFIRQRTAASVDRLSER